LLGVAKLPRPRSVGTIAWSENLPWYMCRFKREGFRKPSQLVLSAPLRESLAPEDWSILLAYYIAHLKPHFSLALRFWAELVVPTSVLALMLAGVRFYWNGVLLLLGNAIIGTLLLTWFIRIFTWAKKMNLKQDIWAANSLGRENLLHLFEKVDS